MKYFMLSLLALLNFASSAMASDWDMSGFKTIPVLHEGRIKPIDSFARIHLKQFSGQDKNAIAWLAETLFTPARAAEQKIFLVHNKELKHQLGINEDKKLFSLIDLQTGLEETKTQLSTLLSKEPDQLSKTQTQLLALHENTLAFTQLMRSFSLVLPLDIDVPEKYQDLIDTANPTYLDLKKIETEVTADLKNLIRRKGQNLKSYNEEETKLAQLSLNLKIFTMAGEQNRAFAIIPAGDIIKTDEWFSPWQLILGGHGSPETKTKLDVWKNLAHAYRTENKAEWQKNIKAIHGLTDTKSSVTKLKLERFYNAAKPFQWAMALYALSIVFIILAFRTEKNSITVSAVAAGSLGTLIHCAGIISRIFLLDRPPVGTLYESVIFVALICTIFGLITFLKSKNFATLFAGLIAALLMLLIAPYLVPNGEDMEMLVAVLNTNFWLTTHVLCITIGYAICVFAACLAHAYLWQRWKTPRSKNLSLLKNMIYKASIAALLFTAVGTALGGIWADQSWGRFWGWDPKENGALLIVLWLVWLQHARHSGKMRDVAFVAGTAFLNVIVAMAWFGVNLLSVGLHSYGFIDGIAVSLSLFFIAETFIIGTLCYLIHKQGKETA